MTNIGMPNTDALMLRADQAKLQNLASGLNAKTEKRINEAAEEFEAMFLSEMLKPMFSGIEVNEIFGGGKGEEVFRDLMIQEYGKTMAKAGGIGLAEHVREELIRQQSAAVKG